MTQVKLRDRLGFRKAVLSISAVHRLTLHPVCLERVGSVETSTGKFSVQDSPMRLQIFCWVCDFILWLGGYPKDADARCSAFPVPPVGEATASGVCSRSRC